MNTRQLNRYNKLVAQATGFFRRDVETKFKFAVLLREMVALTNDPRQVSVDLGMSGRGEVEGYIAVLEFWGDERIPDFPMQPARWSHYRNVIFNYEWQSDPKLREKAKQAALLGGNYEVGKLEREAKSKRDRAHLKEVESRPQAVKDAEARSSAVRHIKSALYNAAVWMAMSDGAAALLTDDDKAAILAEYDHLLRSMTAIGLGVTPSRRVRRAA
jgi:hypothetical protein